MRCFVTGCAGFIGSNLTDRLLALGHQVVGYDSFSTGRREFLNAALLNGSFEFVKGDLLDAGRLESAVAGCELVFHLAANADVRFGTEHPTKDLHQNTIATVNVLEAMRGGSGSHSHPQAQFTEKRRSFRLRRIRRFRCRRPYTVPLRRQGNIVRSPRS